MTEFVEAGRRYVLRSPLLAPQASAFLWNPRMMLQVTCRGYAVAQFTQPEPAKYTHIPALAGVSFMQPEQPYFAHHPGRFFYLRDDDTGELFSAPYEPVRSTPEVFEFAPGIRDVVWRVVNLGIELVLKLELAANEVAEFWTVSVRNTTEQSRRVSLVPYFPVGYSSWMNMAARYEPELGGIVASCVAPYQKLEDYFKRREWKDLTYLVGDRAPSSWEANQAAFEGEGGLHYPEALRNPQLSRGEACYELPACVLQYRLSLSAGEATELRFLFGPAKDGAEIRKLREQWLNAAGFARARKEYAAYIAQGEGCIQISTPDETLNHVANHWLPRQVYYHGDVNRLTTDPQTRNYLQDAMGVAYVAPAKTRHALLTALAQQKANGEMPDGVLLYPGAELKYINQIPHTDHCVWIALCLSAYLNESADWALLDEEVPFANGQERATLYEHLCRGMDWLLAARDERGLSLIAQGDWCDPMNMVGYKGKGVSGWLTQAASYALQCLLPVCKYRGDAERIARFQAGVHELNSLINKHFWDGNWYARGITDDGVTFGVKSDAEGRIFLNPQAWALLCGAADAEQQQKLMAAVKEQLESPYGVELCGPAFTHMREDIGRVTQKFPGSAENGSVYNHAAAFYIAALFYAGEGQAGYALLRKMLPGPGTTDIQQRGQLPVFIPNYYRGAYRQHPRTAGRSSQLVNTGTVAWLYRTLVEQLFGLRGEGQSLRIAPQIPHEWNHARVVRRFRDATIELEVRREETCPSMTVFIDGVACAEPSKACIASVHAGRKYRVEVVLPLPGP